MSTPTMDDAARVLADPTAYADEPRLHAALTHLRANVPVAWSTTRRTGRSGRSPNTQTSWPSSGTTTCSSARRGRCWRPPRRTTC